MKPYIFALTAIISTFLVLLSTFKEGNTHNDASVIRVGFEQHRVGTVYDYYAQSKDWNVVWSKSDWMNNYTMITDSQAHSQTKALRITYPANATAGGSAAWKLPEEKEYYLSYWVKFEEDFDFDGSKESGGKLPGLAGAGGYCSGGQICTGENGFSSRYMWGENGRVKLYLYHMNKPTKWGENFWLEDSEGQDVYFQRGKWHNLIQRVKINDGFLANGEIDVWMDGEEMLSLRGLQFVNNHKSIDSLMFSTFHGGNSSDWWPEREVHSYFDDFVISTSARDVGL